MKTLCQLAVMAALVAPAATWAADQDGVALAIIFDTSGSMREPVRDTNGRDTAKYIVAKRALIQVSKQIEAFAKNQVSGTPRKVEAGLFTFHSDHAATAIPFGPFDAAAIQKWAAQFNQPTGNTPLGNSLSAAWRVVLGSPLPRKHVLVITDGVNTVGPTPTAVLPKAANNRPARAQAVGLDPLRRLRRRRQSVRGCQEAGRHRGGRGG